MLGTHSRRKSRQKVAVPQFPYSTPIDGYSTFLVWLPSSAARVWDFSEERLTCVWEGEDGILNSVGESV